MPERLCEHIRRPGGSAIAGEIRMRCDCGYVAKVPADAGDKKTIHGLLEQIWRTHLPADQRRRYVLVDQRPGHVGNWLMPEGVEVRILNWHEDGGTYCARVVEWDLEAKPETFPVGEIRLADGRVFRIE